MKSHCQKAIPIFEDIVEKQTAKWGENHETVLRSLHNLARCFYKEKQFQKAKTILEDLVEKEISTLGENDQLTIASKLWLENCKKKAK